VLPTNLEDNAGNFNGALSKRGALAKMFIDQSDNIFRWDETYEPLRKDSVYHAAQAQGRSVLDELYAWLCENDGCRVCSLYFMNYHDDSCADCLEMLLFPGAIPGLGDSGAHLGFICDPTSHTHLLTYYARDRTRGPRLALEQVVKLHSADCADAFGLDDRGRLLEGMLADINVIDLPRLKVHCPKMVHDLPENASRWIQTCEGYDYTIKSGVVTQRKGKPTGALPGKLVRGKAFRDEKARQAWLRKLPCDSTSATPAAGLVGLACGATLALRILRQGGPARGVIGALCAAMISGVATGYALGGGYWLSKARWEFEQKAFELLLSAAGPNRLEALGDIIANKFPLRSRIG
jgi:hypothetical protein